MSRKGIHSDHTRFHTARRKRLRRRERLVRGIRHTIGYINRQCSGYLHKARFTRAILLVIRLSDQDMAGVISTSWIALATLLLLNGCSWMLAEGQTCSLSGII